MTFVLQTICHEAYQFSIEHCHWPLSGLVKVNYSLWFSFSPSISMLSWYYQGPLVTFILRVSKTSPRWELSFNYTLDLNREGRQETKESWNLTLIADMFNERETVRLMTNSPLCFFRYYLTVRKAPWVEAFWCILRLNICSSTILLYYQT